MGGREFRAHFRFRHRSPEELEVMFLRSVLVALAAAGLWYRRRARSCGASGPRCAGGRAQQSWTNSVNTAREAAMRARGKRARLLLAAGVAALCAGPGIAGKAINLQLGAQAA